jgi:hypothetical protein
MSLSLSVPLSLSVSRHALVYKKQGNKKAARTFQHIQLQNVLDLRTCILSNIKSLLKNIKRGLLLIKSEAR